MPDGIKRKRRNRGDKRSKWYAAYRSARFARRFGTANGGVDIAFVCAKMR
jgi:hypothetical protein